MDDASVVHTVHVSIGNSDGKLTQARWSGFIAAMYSTINAYAERIHGVWYSLPTSPYTNACWSFDVHEMNVDLLRGALSMRARQYGQDSIAWLSGETEFIAGEKP